MTGLYCIVISSALKAFILYTLWNACIVAAGLGVMSYILVNSGMCTSASYYYIYGLIYMICFVSIK